MYFSKILFLCCLLIMGLAQVGVASGYPLTICGGPVYSLEDDIARISPNPADTEFGIWANEEITLVQIEMINGQGVIVRNVFPDAGFVSINTAPLDNGLYSLRITTHHAVHYAQIVVQH